MKIKKVIKMLIKQGPFAVLRAIRDHYRKKKRRREIQEPGAFTSSDFGW